MIHKDCEALKLCRAHRIEDGTITLCELKKCPYDVNRFKQAEFIDIPRDTYVCTSSGEVNTPEMAL